MPAAALDVAALTAASNSLGDGSPFARRLWDRGRGMFAALGTGAREAPSLRVRSGLDDSAKLRRKTALRPRLSLPSSRGALPTSMATVDEMQAFVLRACASLPLGGTGDSRAMGHPRAP